MKPPTWGNCYMSFLPLVNFTILCHSKNSLEKTIRNMKPWHLWSNCDLLEFWARNLAPGCWPRLSITCWKIFSCNFLSRFSSLTVQFYKTEKGLSCHVERDFLKCHSRPFVLCINANKEIVGTGAVNVTEGNLSSFLLYTQHLRTNAQHLKKDLVIISGVPSPCCHRQSSTNGLPVVCSLLSLLSGSHLD